MDRGYFPAGIPIIIIPPHIITQGMPMPIMSIIRSHISLQASMLMPSAGIILHIMPSLVISQVIFIMGIGMGIIIMPGMPIGDIMPGIGIMPIMGIIPGIGIIPGMLIAGIGFALISISSRVGLPLWPTVALRHAGLQYRPWRKVHFVPIDWSILL